MYNLSKKLLFILLVLFTFNTYLYSNDDLHNQTEDLIKEIIISLQKYNITSVKNIMTPELRKQVKQKNLMSTCNLFNKQGNIKKIDMVGSHIVTVDNKTSIRNSSQIEFNNSYFLIRAEVKKTNNKLLLNGFEYNKLPQSLQEMNRFTLSSKDFTHYIVLLLTILMPIFIIITLVICIRTKLNKKWLWIIFIIFGIGTISFNWTTGEFGFRIIHFQLLGASFIKNYFAPLILNFSFPIGAVTFLLKRNKILENSTKKAADKEEKK